MKCFVSHTGRDPRFPQDVKDFLRSQGLEIIANPYHGTISETQLIELIRDADATMASNEPYTARVFDALPQLKMVARVGVGYDAVDVRAATERGVVVTTTPVPELAKAMAEHTFGLLLGLAKRIPQMNHDLRQGEWRAAKWGGLIEDLYGLTLGLVGVGRIGSEVARKAKSFDMRVLYFDTIRRTDLEESLGIEYVQMDRLLAESDVLSLHTPLTEQTRGMIGDDAFSKMKRTAILVNTARGAVVDEDALVRALASERIAGACIDAYSVEPLAAPHPLHGLGERLPNLIVTPHLGYGPRTGRAMIYHAARQVVDGLAGKDPPNVLNPEVLPHRRH